METNDFILQRAAICEETVTCTIFYICQLCLCSLCNLLIYTSVPSLDFTFNPGITVRVLTIFFTLREPNVYKPRGFFLGFLGASFVCFCVTVLFYGYLYFVRPGIATKSPRGTVPDGVYTNLAECMDYFC